MDEMTPQARQNRAQIGYIRCRLITGLISYDEAKRQAKPILDQMNAAGARIARNHGVKYKPLTFTSIFR